MKIKKASLALQILIYEYNLKNLLVERENWIKYVFSILFFKLCANTYRYFKLSDHSLQFIHSSFDDYIF